MAYYEEAWFWLLVLGFTLFTVGIIGLVFLGFFGALWPWITTVLGIIVILLSLGAYVLIPPKIIIIKS